MLCCVLPLLLLGVLRRVLHLGDRSAAPAMPPPARRGVDVGPTRVVGPVR